MTSEDPFQSPALSLPELPPIDYEDRVKAAQVNGVDHCKCPSEQFSSTLLYRYRILD